MRATLIYGAGDVRVATVPDPKLHEPTDAVVRVLRSCVCGSDLWPYASKPESATGDRIGHEFLGVVEEVGAAVSGLRPGDVVVAPFVWADNTCDFCQEGLQTSCRHGGYWGQTDVDGGQGEAVRVPQAQGTLVKLPVGEDSALLPSLLTLSDVFPTGHHCAVTAGVGPRTTVTVIGDGAVGLCAVLAAKRLGAVEVVAVDAQHAAVGPAIARERAHQALADPVPLRHQVAPGLPVAGVLALEPVGGGVAVRRHGRPVAARRSGSPRRAAPFARGRSSAG